MNRYSDPNHNPKPNFNVDPNPSPNHSTNDQFELLLNLAMSRAVT